MNKIIITERMKTVMKRWIDLSYFKCACLLAELEEKEDEEHCNELMDQDNLDQIIFYEEGSSKLILKINLICKSDDFDFEELALRVELHCSVLGKQRKSIDLGIEQHIEQIYQKIDKLTEVNYCKDCEFFLAEKDDLCRFCYPWVTTGQENCCICLENPLKVWIKLPCGHELHKNCFDKMDKKKCPLCRADKGIHTWKKI